MPPRAVPKPKPFATEADLCAAFIADIGPNWTAYPETAGWDMLLIRKADGFQIGVQAKLRLNAHVISQALESWGSSADRPGPDCRALLVPGVDGRLTTGAEGFTTICEYIGLHVIRAWSPGAARPYQPAWGRSGRCFHPALPGEPGDSEKWHEWAPLKRHALPEYVPDVPAGASAPRQLSRWKIKAIKISVVLENRGYVTRADFRHIQLDHRRFLTSGLGWLIPDEKSGGYVRTKLWPNMKTQHPRAYDQIAADYPKWSLPQGALQLATARRPPVRKAML